MSKINMNKNAEAMAVQKSNGQRVFFAILGFVTLALFWFIFAASHAAHACTMSQQCLDSLAQRESGGDYGITNQYDFLGKYQFGEAALIDAGYYTHDGTSASCPASQGGCDWRGTWTGKDGINSREQFLASPQAQENAILEYQNRTWGYIENLGLDQYLGQTVGGIPITCDNLLTGYHLKGGGGLQTFLGSGGANDPADANGTQISEYLDLGADCSGMGGGQSVMAAANTQSSCDQNILTTGQQLSEANMNIDKGVIDQMIQPPQSVMELSCFDQFGEMFNQEIGAIFSDVTQGLEAFNFGGIFQDAQASIMSEMSGLIFGDRAANFGGQISSALGDAFSGILGSSNVEYGCEVMQVMWDILQCENMLDFDIPSLQDLIGGGGGGAGFMDSLKPDSCTGQALFDGAMRAADQAFGDFGGNLPQQLQPSNIENLIRSY